MVTRMAKALCVNGLGLFAIGAANLTRNVGSLVARVAQANGTMRPTLGTAAAGHQAPWVLSVVAVVAIPVAGIVCLFAAGLAGDVGRAPDAKTVVVQGSMPASIIVAAVT